MRTSSKILLAILALSIAVLSQTSGISLYQEGNSAYSDGEYQIAVDSYEKAIQSGVNDHRVYYNLGNAYFKMGNIGEAILNYNRARTIKPRNKDILYNLKYAREFTKDKIEDIYSSGFLGIIYQGIEKISYYEIMAILLITSLLGTIAVIVFLFTKNNLRKWCAGLSIAFWAIFLIVLVPYYLKSNHIWENNLGVVIASKADLRSAPTTNAEIQYSVHAGTEIAVLERRSDYVRVKLRNGGEGWMQSHKMEEVVQE